MTNCAYTRAEVRTMRVAVIEEIIVNARPDALTTMSQKELDFIKSNIDPMVIEARLSTYIGANVDPLEFVRSADARVIKQETDDGTGRSKLEDIKFVPSLKINLDDPSGDGLDERGDQSP